MNIVWGVTGAAVLALSGTAFAADAPAVSQGVVQEAASSNWTGAYIGAHLGYGPGTFSFPSLDYTMSVSGPFVGGQVGYNFAMVDGVVFGVEADMNLADETGSFTDTVDPVHFVDTFRLDWTGAVTAHVGVDAGAFMPYLLGGVAFAHGSESLSSDLGSASTTATHVGWTAGVGVATKVSSDMSAFLEGRYSDYGSATYSGTGNEGSGPVAYSFDGDLTDWTIRGGLNWHIN